MGIYGRRQGVAPSFMTPSKSASRAFVTATPTMTTFASIRSVGLQAMFHQPMGGDASSSDVDADRQTVETSDPFATAIGVGRTGRSPLSGGSHVA